MTTRSQASRFSKGFTLVELMVTIGIVAILSVMAIPNFISWLPKTQTGSAAREILTTIQLAKIAAVKESANVVVHFTVASGELLAFVDDGAGGGMADDRVRNGSERLVRKYTMPPGVTLALPSLGTDLEFTNRGLPNAGGDVSVSSSGGTKTIRVMPSGHARIM
ncbi:MAG: prepilin-type N-terminal cleavage/methylation domain-containing protein [Planctomycetaceae bacterium]|nr:MAG: prepilin-type N-terminal cleavage/methylation domain-containing protein [Planctomycetaceae bacterium]